MSNYTQLGFVKQTDGENTGTWGDVLNENLIDLLDDAIGGYVEVSVASGNVTLAFADGTADNNGRHAVIKFTGSPGTTRTVTFPDAQINYFIINGSDASVICTSGSGAATVTIPTGMKDIIYVDGSDEILSMFATPHISGNVTIGVDDTGYDVKFFGATSGSYLLWDESADSLLLTDSTPLKIGDSQDLTLYHDGSNSYITTAVGALKIATETSGIAVTIGHTTSETTIADNATITGNLSVGGNFDVTGTLDFSDSAITNVGDIALDTITNDGTDITLDSSNDIVIDAAGGNIEFKDAGTLQFTIDMDGTANAQVIKLGVNSDDLIFQQYDGNEVIRVADDRRLYFYDKGGEYIYGDGTDLHIVSGADINIPADIGLTFGDDGEKIEGDGTDLTITGNNIKLTATADVVIPADVGITFGTGEKIEGNNTDLTITSGADIALTATSDINVPSGVGMTFGDDGEKIEGDGTDLTIASSGVLNLAAGGSTNQIKVTDGAILPITDDDVDLGSASYQFKNAYFDGTLEADAITIGGSAITAGGATKGFAIAVAIAL